MGFFKKSMKLKGGQVDFDNYLTYKNLIDGSSVFKDENVIEIISNVRKKARNQSVANNIFNDLMKIGKFKDAVTSIVKSTDLDVRKYTLNAIDSSSIDENIEFIVILLSHYIDELKYLVNKKNIIQSEIFKNENENENEISVHIDELVERCGLGVWCVSNKMSHLYFTGQDEKVVDFRSKIPANLDKFSEAALIYECSKSRSTVTYESYLQSINRQLEDIRFYGFKFLEDHLKFNSLFEPNDSYEDLRVLISISSLNRLPDLYFFLIRILKYCFIHIIKVERTLRLLSRFYKSIGDNELDIIVEKHNGDYLSSSNNEELLKSIIDSYIKGEHSQVQSRSLQALNSSPNLTVIYEIISKSKNSYDIDLSLPPLVSRIIHLYSNLDEKKDVEQSVKELKLIFLNLKHFDWAYHIKAKIDRFSFNGHYTSSKNYAFADSSQIKIIPFDHYGLQNIHNIYGLAKINDYYRGYDAARLTLCHLFNSSEYEQTDIPEWRMLKLKAENYFHKKDYENSLKLYEILLDDTPVETCHFELNSRLIESYFLNEQYDLSLVKLAKSLLDGHEPSIYPLSAFASYIKDNVAFDANSEILEAASIILYFYNIKHPKDDVTQYLSNIVEQLIISIGIDSSQKLKIENWSSSIFILSHVMTIDVMDGFIMLFDDDIEMYTAKLNICSSLLGSDFVKDSKKYYIHITNEYRSTFNRMVLHICNSDLNEGRINIDKESLKVLLLDELTTVFENLDRNVTIKDIKLVNSGAEKNEAILSGNRTIGALGDCILQIAKEYTINKLHGLDNCLNLRFRHGEIANHLRSPLRKHGIAGVKISETEFNVDEVFQDYTLFNENNLEKAKSAHSIFLTKLNQAILEFRNRCSADTADFISDAGKFFNYSLSIDLINGFVNDFSKGKQIDAVIESVFSWMDDYTEKHLYEIRTKHIPALGDVFNSLFDNLVKELDAAPNAYYRKLNLARSELNERLAELKVWFDWSAEPSSPFNFGAVVEKSFQIVSSLYPTTDLKKSFTDTVNILIKPSFFTTLVTIFTLAIENAAKHCGFSHKIDVDVKVSVSDNQLIIQLNNPITQNAYEVMSRKISVINSDLADNFGDRAAHDSGSGIFKVKTLLVDRLKLDADLHIKLESNVFLLQITIYGISKLAYENSYS